MLLALGSFAYKYYSLSPNHPHTPVMEENIIKLLNKIEAKALKITPLEHDCECYSLYHEPSFTLSFFVMKAGHFMPLHDHPGMTVFIKLLEGEILLSTYEFVCLPGSQEPVKMIDAQGQELLKCNKMTHIITPTSPFHTSVLKPTGRTMHSFRSLSDRVIFLDIIGPPYDEEDRNCKYYTDVAEQAPLPASNNTLPPLLSTSGNDSTSSSSAYRAGNYHTLENGAVLPLDTEVEAWIIKSDIVYECFSKHYEPHQT